MNTNGRYATSSPVASTSHQHPASHPGASLPPLSLSILGVEPLDEFIKDIADFVHHMITTRPEGLNGLIEVEAKIGVLKEKGGGGQRVRLPVRCESILEPGGMDVRFESNMSQVRFLSLCVVYGRGEGGLTREKQAQHKHFNQLLNNLKTDPPPSATTPIEYSHLYLVDNFYADPNAGHDPILQELLASLQGTPPCLPLLPVPTLRPHPAPVHPSTTIQFFSTQRGSSKANMVSRWRTRRRQRRREDPCNAR